MPSVLLKPTYPSYLPLHSTIQIERRTNQRQMAKSLRRIPQLLATPRNLLREHAQMITEIEHVLEDVDRSHQVLLVVDAGARARLDQPERAHAEGAFGTAHPVVRLLRVVPVHEAGGGEAAALGREQDAVYGPEEARVVGGDEEDERGDEDAGVQYVARFVGLLEAVQGRGVAEGHDLFVDFVTHFQPFGAVGAGETAFVG